MTADEFEETKKSITCWEEAVSWIEKGWDCEDEYSCDVTARHAVFLLLENNGGNLPAELQLRLDAADARYRAATLDDWPFTSCKHTSDLDQQQHWYWFRRPEEVSIRKAWENDPEYRQLLEMNLPTD